MRVSISTFALVVSLLAPAALGAPQGLRATAILETSGTPTQLNVFDMELEAGGLFPSGTFDLLQATPFPIATFWDAQRIHDELWIATSDGVLVYEEDVTGSGPRYTFRDHFLQGQSSRRVYEDPGGHALVVTTGNLPFVDSVNAVDAAGNQTLLQGFFGIGELVPFQGGYLVTSVGYVGRYDSDFEYLENLGQLGDRVVVLDDGRAAIQSGLASVTIIDSLGDVETVFTPGPPSNINGVVSGGLLVTEHLELFDPETGEFFAVSRPPGQPFPAWQGFSSMVSPPTFSSRRQGSGRSCTATPNSTGESAWVYLLGSNDASSRILSLVATRMPPNTLAVPIFGTGAFDAAYGDGRLCVSPLQPSLTRGPAQAVSDFGSMQIDFDFATPGLGAAFGPGTTWYHQVLYRDAGGPTGFNATDAVSVSLR